MPGTDEPLYLACVGETKEGGGGSTALARPLPAGHDHVRQKWLKVGRELFCLLSCRACSGGPRRACLPQLSVTQQSDGRSRGGSHVCESLAGWDAH